MGEMLMVISLIMMNVFVAVIYYIMERKNKLAIMSSVDKYDNY